MTPDGITNNPFFALEAAPRSTDGWRTVADLATDRDLLRRKVTATATALDTQDLRVAASVDHLGTCARIASPLLHFVGTRSAAPDVAPDRLWWRPARPGPIRLAATLAPVAPATPEAVLERIVDGVLAPLVPSYGSAYQVSPQVLWGNVASALDGARKAIAATEVDGIVRAVLGLGELARTAERLPPAFRRTSCCLFYRLPGGGLCGDCVLKSREG